MTRFCWVLLIAFAVHAQDHGQEWTRFRGPNGSGVSEAKGLPTEFGASKNLLWKTAIPYGRSSPVIAGDRIFLTASEGDKLLTLSLDRNSGRIVWRREIVRPRTTSIYRLNDAASPSPATDGKNVYTFFMDFGLVSYAPDGKERWRLPLGPFKTFFGLAASPIVSGNTLLMLCDARPQAFLVAVDSATGKVRWRAERPPVHAEGYTTPILYEPAGQAPQVVTLGPHRVDSYAVSNGEHLWWLRGLGSFPVGSPVLAKDLMIVNTFGGEEQAMPSFDSMLKNMDKDGDGKLSAVEVKVDKDMGEMFPGMDGNGNGFVERDEWQAMLEDSKGDFGVIAIKLGKRGDLTSAAYAWRETKAFNNLPSPLVYQDILYLPKNGGIVAAFDPQSGKAHKMARAHDPGKEMMDEFFASPVAADGKIYFTSASCKVAVLKAGAQWEMAAMNDLGTDADAECHATPAIAGGKIYFRTRGAILAFGEKR